jgi:hypothetical protein
LEMEIGDGDGELSRASKQRQIQIHRMTKKDAKFWCAPFWAGLPRGALWPAHVWAAHRICTNTYTFECVYALILACIYTCMCVCLYATFTCLVLCPVALALAPIWSSWPSCVALFGQELLSPFGYNLCVSALVLPACPPGKSPYNLTSIRSHPLRMICSGRELGPAQLASGSIMTDIWPRASKQGTKAGVRCFCFFRNTIVCVLSMDTGSCRCHYHATGFLLCIRVCMNVSWNPTVELG